MKFSESWLREWVDSDLSTEALVKVLTMAGLEIDGDEPVAASFEGVVVAEVRDVAQHPDADKLRVCQVFDGEATLQVVCGAANVRPGLKVPFARIGAVLGADFRIRKAKLRGVESNGMLCSAEELGMAESADGLLELPADAPTGLDIRNYLQLDDRTIEVDLTPNRGDCLGIAGLARELAALTGKVAIPPEMPAVPARIEDSFPVDIEAPADCPVYLGRVIRNINPEVDTPLWMQEKLRRSGLRSIDPVVDVTNYVMLELGQPMHAFDLDQLQGGIRVRRALAGETLQLLDGKELTLDDDTLVIADHKRALAMAGIMGGKESGVGPLTRNIFLECAGFAPLAIAGRARRHGLHTDSSHRYERGVDPCLQARAIERATALLLAISGGEPGPVIEGRGQGCEARCVRLRRERIAALLGMSFDDDEVVAILQRLGLVLAESGEGYWIFEVPSWRYDLGIEADLIEELARVKGYEHVPVSAPRMPLRLRPAPETRLPLRRVRHALADLGYQEVVTYSFVDAELDEVLRHDKSAANAAPLELANPISRDMAVMRSTLWPGLVKTLKHNQNRQQSRLRLFETGLSFNRNNNDIEQSLKIASLVWGAQLPEQWGQAERPADFFDLKGDVEALLDLTHAADQFRFVEATHPALQPGMTARIERGGELAGWIGALHPRICQAIDIPGKVFLMELDFAILSGMRVPAVTEVSRFPAVRRDLALVVDEGVAASALLEVLQRTGGESLLEVGFFDLYQGDSIGKGKKSLALSLTFQHPTRTLSDSDINPIIDSCIKTLHDEFKAELR